MHLARLPQLLGGQLESLVLGFFGLISGVGIYTAALQMSRVGELVPLSLISVALPLISAAYDRGGEGQVSPLLKTGTRWGLTVALPVFVVTVRFAAPLLSIFGEEFLAGRSSLVLLACIPVLRATTGLTTAVFSMTGYARINAANSVVYLGTALVLDVTLIPKHESFGAAVAAVAAIALVSGLRLIELYWLFRMHPFDRSLLKPVGATVAAAASGYAASQALASPSPIAEPLIGIGVIIVVYCAVLLALGIPESDRMVLERVLGRLGKRGAGKG
jgi:O-antigen/teichoic acid export membrane protein